MVWALFNEMLPDKDGNRAITMGHRTYATKAEAQAQCDQIRRENLPFKAWPVEVCDPREAGAKLGDGTPDAALAIGEHAFRAGYEAGHNHGSATPGEEA